MATRVATDDAARRQEFIWLGPVNSPAPFEARGQAWLAGIVVLPVLVVVAFLVVPGFAFSAAGLPGPLAFLAHVLTAVAVGCAVGILLIRAVGRRVQPTRPLQHHVAVAQTEVTSPRITEAITYERQVPTHLFLEDRPEHRTTYVRAPHLDLTTSEGIPS